MPPIYDRRSFAERQKARQQPAIENLKTRLTERQQDITTLMLAWEQFFPNFAVAEQRWLHVWLNHNPLATVLGAFEFVATDKFYKTSEHLSKVISVTLKSVTYER
jgi:hypothetical protein